MNEDQFGKEIFSISAKGPWNTLQLLTVLLCYSFKSKFIFHVTKYVLKLHARTALIDPFQGVMKCTYLGKYTLVQCRISAVCMNNFRSYLL